MPQPRRPIDYTELKESYPARGEGLEKLVFAIAEKLRLTPEPSGRGPDGGRDLKFTEIVEGSISHRVQKWVVSCKDYASSNTSVGESDLPSIENKVIQHQCAGFLLVTTTTVGAAAKAVLDAAKDGSHGRYMTAVWDAATLDSILIKPENHDILRQFLPNSYVYVRQMTTLEGVLTAFKDDLPTDVFDQVLQLTEPYSKHSLLGRSIWPGDERTSNQLDQIVKAIVIENDLENAAQYAKETDPAAVLHLLDQMLEPYPTQSIDFAKEAIKHLDDPSYSLTLINWLRRETPFEFEENIELLSYLDPSGLSWLLEDAAQIFVSEKIFSSDFINRVYDQINEEGARSYEIDDITVLDVEFEVADESIFFKGTLEVSASLTYDKEAEVVRPMTYFGDFEGFLDDGGMTLEEVYISPNLDGPEGFDDFGPDEE